MARRAWCGVRVSVGLRPEDLCVTLGYFIPGIFPSQMKIYFVPEFEGYIWSFPRPDSHFLRTDHPQRTRMDCTRKNAAVELHRCGSGCRSSCDRPNSTARRFPVWVLGPGRRIRFPATDGRWSAMPRGWWIRSPVKESTTPSSRPRSCAETIDQPKQYAVKVLQSIGRELAARLAHVQTVLSRTILRRRFQESEQSSSRDAAER